MQIFADDQGTFS